MCARSEDRRVRGAEVGRNRQPWASTPEDEDLSQGDGVGMRQRQKRRNAANRGEAAGSAAVKLQLRRTSVPHDLDVAPEDPECVSRAERFHGGFLRREARRKPNLRHSMAGAVRHLTFGEDAVHEPIAVARDGVGNSRNVGDVQP